LKKLKTHITLLYGIVLLAFPQFLQSQEKETRTDSAYIYYEQALNYYQQDSFNYSFRAISRAYQLLDSVKDKALLGRLYGVEGYIFLNRGAGIKAAESFTKAKTLGSEVNRVDIELGGYHGLGRVYITLGELDIAHQYLTEGLAICQKENLQRQTAIFNNALGLLEQHRGKYTEAINYFSKFKDVSTAINDTLSIIYSSINLGETYSKLGHLDSAKNLIFRAQLLNKRVNNAQARAAILGNLGRIKFYEKDYEKSLDYLNQCMVVSYENDFSDFIVENYTLIIDNYEALGNMPEVIATYKEMDNYKDSINLINNLKKTEGLEAQLHIQEEMATAMFWKQKYHNRNIVLILSISLSLVIVILLLMLAKRFQQSRSKHREETRTLNHTIDEKNRELVSRMLSENQRKTAIDQLSKSLDYITKEKDVDQIKQHLTDVKRDLTSKEQIGNNWESFKVHFEKVHPTFFDSVLKIEPNLTPSELRMCAYIKMNLSTKEIANLLNISDRSIQTNRYRLKKKLKLDPQQNLITYIQSF
jgi:tetratricopeptide (TPR) repeat protein